MSVLKLSFGTENSYYIWPFSSSLTIQLFRLLYSMTELWGKLKHCRTRFLQYHGFEESLDFRCYFAKNTVRVWRINFHSPVKFFVWLNLVEKNFLLLWVTFLLWQLFRCPTIIRQCLTVPMTLLKGSFFLSMTVWHAFAFDSSFCLLSLFSKSLCHGSNELPWHFIWPMARRKNSITFFDILTRVHAIIKFELNVRTRKFKVEEIKCERDRKWGNEEGSILPTIYDQVFLSQDTFMKW